MVGVNEIESQSVSEVETGHKIKLAEELFRSKDDIERVAVLR